MWDLPERHEHLSAARWQVADLNPMALPLSGMCACHHDTRVPNENTTSLQPSPSLQPSSPPTRLPAASDNEDGFAELMCQSWKSIFRHMYASTFMRPCTVWLDSETCSRARRGEFTLGERCSRHNDTSSVSKRRSPAVSMFWHALRKTQHHWKRPRRVVGKTGSDIHVAITWVCVRFKGQLWR